MMSQDEKDIRKLVADYLGGRLASTAGILFPGTPTIPHQSDGVAGCMDGNKYPPKAEQAQQPANPSVNVNEFKQAVGRGIRQHRASTMRSMSRDAMSFLANRADATSQVDIDHCRRQLLAILSDMSHFSKFRSALFSHTISLLSKFAYGDIDEPRPAILNDALNSRDLYDICALLRRAAETTDEISVSRLRLLEEVGEQHHGLGRALALAAAQAIYDYAEKKKHDQR